MIEGFRIEMTAEELIRYLGGRADHHRDAAAECDRRRQRASSSTSTIDSGDPDQQIGMFWPCWVDELQRHAANHRRREAAFAFLHDHVAAHEVYRLDRTDLRFLEMWPRPAGEPEDEASEDA